MSTILDARFLPRPSPPSGLAGSILSEKEKLTLADVAGKEYVEDIV